MMIETLRYWLQSMMKAYKNTPSQPQDQNQDNNKKKANVVVKIGLTLHIGSRWILKLHLPRCRTICISFEHIPYIGKHLFLQSILALLWLTPTTSPFGLTFLLLFCFEKRANSLIDYTKRRCCCCLFMKNYKIILIRVYFFMNNKAFKKELGFVRIVDWEISLKVPVFKLTQIETKGTKLRRVVQIASCAQPVAKATVQSGKPAVHNRTEVNKRIRAAIFTLKFGLHADT